MTCRQAERHFLAHGQGDATPPGFGEHLASCDACQGAFREYQAAAAAVRAVGGPEVPGRFAGQVMDRVRAEGQLRRAASPSVHGLGLALAAAATVAVVWFGGMQWVARNATPEPAPAATSQARPTGPPAGEAPALEQGGGIAAPATPPAKSAEAPASEKSSGAPAQSSEPPQRDKGQVPGAALARRARGAGVAPVQAATTGVPPTAASPDREAERGSEPLAVAGATIRPGAASTAGGAGAGPGRPAAGVGPPSPGPGAAAAGPSGPSGPAGRGGLGGRGGGLGGGAFGGSPGGGLAGRQSGGADETKAGMGGTGAPALGAMSGAGAAPGPGDRAVAASAFHDFAFSDTLVRQALRAVARSGGVTLSMSSRVPMDARISVTMSRVTAKAAVERICEEAGLDVRGSGPDRYLIDAPRAQ